MPTSTHSCEPTAEEFIQYINDFPDHGSFKHKKERAFAIVAGWKDSEYLYLYKKYLISTQRKADPKTFKGKDKGDALEDLARYFLKHGAIVKDINDLKAGSKWQVDGQGIINKSIMQFFWGEDLIQEIGFQLYLECKNLIEPTAKNDFNDHCTRMDDNNCRLGVMASTSGFKINQSKGIAERIYLNTFKKRFYLLLSIRDFDLVYSEKMPPISVITEALDRTTNDKYRSDKATEKQYTKDYCHQIAKERHDELINGKTAD